MPNTKPDRTGTLPHNATAPQVAGPDPADVEAVAIVFLAETYPTFRSLMGGPWSGANPAQKRRALDAARGAIAALIERGWKKEP